MHAIWITRRVAPVAALLCGIGRWGHAPGATLPRVEVSEAIRSAPPAPLVAPRNIVPRTDTLTDTAAKPPRFPVIGRPAPPLRVAHWLHVAKGNPLTFGDGHIYILDFTALWCGSCPATYPILHDLLAQYGAARVRPIFVTQLWGLAEDHATLLRPAEELASFPAYFARHHVTEPVAILDTVQSALNVYTDDGNGSIALPKLILIDGRGIVREVMTGWDAGRARRRLLSDVARLVVPTVHDSGKVRRTSLHLQLPREAAQLGLTVQSLSFPNNGTFPDIAVRAAGVRWSPDTTSVLIRNVAFLRQHKPDVDALGLFPLPLPLATAEELARQKSQDTTSDGATLDRVMAP